MPGFLPLATAYHGIFFINKYHDTLTTFIHAQRNSGLATYITYCTPPAQSLRWSWLHNMFEILLTGMQRPWSVGWMMQNIVGAFLHKSYLSALYYCPVQNGTKDCNSSWLFYRPMYPQIIYRCTYYPCLLWSWVWAGFATAGLPER